MHYHLHRKDPYKEHYDKVKVNEYMSLDELAKVLEELVKKFSGMFTARFSTYVTVHAKTSLVCAKIEIHFLSPAYSYTH